jgi:3-phenylpropionate/cinnamic acid dioxygenase small subunit
MSTTTTSAQPQQAIWAAVEQLLAKYTWSHDSRDFEALAQCFTDTAEYTMRIAEGAESAPTVGGEAISALVRKFKETQTDQRRHVITNIVIDEATGASARIRSYVTVFATEGDVSRLVATGTCTDKVELQSNGQWKFARKNMHLDKGF